MRTSQLAGQTVVSAGTAPSATNALKFSDIGVGDDVDVWLMLDANDITFHCRASSAMEDPTPFSIAV